MQMNKYSVVTIILSLLCFNVCARPEENAMFELLKNIEFERNVVQIDIIQYPPEALVRAALSPERLEDLYDYKFTARNYGVTVYLQSLKKVLKNTNAKPYNGSVDLRWGLFLIDKKGHRIVSIYLDGFGKYGMINSETVEFSETKYGGGIHQWLRNNFPVKY